MECLYCFAFIKTSDIPDDEDRICIYCGHNHGKRKDEGRDH